MQPFASFQDLNRHKLLQELHKFNSFVARISFYQIVNKVLKGQLAQHELLQLQELNQKVTNLHCSGKGTLLILLAMAGRRI